MNHFSSLYVRIFLWAIFFLPSTFLPAQENKLFEYHVKNGLPTDIIKDVAQDSFGFLWIATDDGLVKYDGAHFTSYKSALQSQYAKRFLKSRKGNLYLAGDLDLIEIENRIDTVVFKKIRTGTRNPADSTLWYPKSIYEDVHFNLWLGEPQSVVMIKDKSFKRFPFSFEDQTPVFTRSFSFFEDKAGNLFTTSFAGRTFQLINDGKEFILYKHLPPSVNDLKVAGDTLWIATNNGLFYAVLHQEGGFSDPVKAASVVAASFVQPLSDGRLIITTFNRDHYYFYPRTQKLEALPYSIKDVNAVLLLPDGDLFLCSGQGLILLRGNIFQTIQTPGFDPTFIESIAEDPLNKTIYFTTAENLFKISDPNTVSDVKLIYRLPGKYFQSMIVNQNRLWISNRAKIFLFENEKKVKEWNFEPEGRFIFDLSSDKEGNVWASQDGNNKVICFTPHLQIKRLSIPLAPQSGVNAVRQAGKGIYAASAGANSYLFFKTNEDSIFKNVSVPPSFTLQGDLSVVDIAEVGPYLWLASSEGLLRYDGKNLDRVNLGKLHTTQAVKSIERYDENEILIANSLGLLRYNYKTGDWWFYNEGNGLATNSINTRGILLGSDQKVWVGTSLGIAFSNRSISIKRTTASPWIDEVLVNGASKKFMNGLSVKYASYIDIQLASNTYPEGVVALQYKMDQDTSWKDLEGSRIHFADLTAGKHLINIRAKKNGGFDWSTPRSYELIILKPYWQQYWFFILISVILFIVSWLSYHLAKAIAKRRRIKLEKLLEEITSKNKQLEEQSAEINKSHAELQKLYREVNEQSEELQAQAEELTEANVTLTKLSADLKSKNEEVLAQAEELTESNETIRQLNEGLEQKVLEKSRDLIQTNKELSKYNTDLLQFSYSVSHNLRGPVARMLGLTDILSSASTDGERVAMVQMIQSSAVELDGVLRDLTNIIELRKNVLNIRDKVFFAEEWKRCLSLMGDQVQNDFNILVDFSQCEFMYGGRGLVQSIMYNLFNNAIKYRSPDRSLTVEVKTWKKGNETYFQIKDNGLGFDMKEQREKVFKLYKRFHTHVPGRGLGLYLVKTQTEILNGRVEAESKLNGGATFTIIVPDPESIERQVFFENDTALLFYDANVNCTVINWKREVNTESYRTAFEMVLSTLQTYCSPGWIADLRHQGVVSSDDQLWFATNILPVAIECGLKRIAAIGFSDPAKAVYHKRMIQKSKELGFIFQNFETLSAAKEWMAGGYRKD